ncbi:hypothetical protein HNQ94_000435 [Salirhabdus euzebyi]|uniref:Uncharacterized protein n=1 Tax=Salirhabdus euzebyi TaxID=394506 RepID=A0A841PW46_9BACI|nr:hypothetical protein [Salirhabdus euzebyi]MBB6452014.1 hypothetical protein [Salirhabdus euzebyi]
MNLTELKKHALAAQLANEYGISVMWRNEIMLKPRLFVNILFNFNPTLTVHIIREDPYFAQISFEHEEFKYFTIVDQDGYKLIEEIVLQKDIKKAH